MSIHILDPFNDLCPFCLEELKRGVPENGTCDHEKTLNTYPHLRFNAFQRMDAASFADSKARFLAASRRGD